MAGAVMDVQTAFELGAVLTLALGGVLMFVARDLPRDLRASVRSWTAGTVLQATAYFLFSRQPAWPQLLTIVLANACFVGGLTGYWRAVRQFDGRPDRPALWLPIAFNVPLISLFTYALPSTTARFVVSSAIAACLFGWTGLSLLRIRSIRQSASRHLLLGICCVASVYMGSRALYYGLVIEVPSGLLRQGAAASADALLAPLLPVTSTAAFLALSIDRVRRRFERIAATDHLTGLLSRRSLDAAGESAFALRNTEDRALTVLLADIDHFKRINDEAGHAVGDQVLRDVARALQSQVRAGDLVGRFGGEEFLVVARFSRRDESRVLAERLRARVRRTPISANGWSFTVTVSIGIASCCERDTCFEDLVQRADVALYDAKQAGRDRVSLAESPTRNHAFDLT
ncbi:GGDEF domain-containing protein [Pseudomarimonas arenosa]|uniref:diguanylate cyclase n=1 Tax=Pseudomarimonas arenosa TaxID=2774145 RepID=A0AAW3ZHD6_9GAMM|nr:GGDEF domain-containing protein [Pseudomarimonas arenosa]MBD8524365.1 GGDEF domain-containing protein [Pseudomarimonas arenosa]